MSALPADWKPVPRLAWREATPREVEMIGFVKQVVAEQAEENAQRTASAAREVYVV